MPWPPATGPIPPRPNGHQLSREDLARWLRRGDGSLEDLARSAQVSPESVLASLHGAARISVEQRRCLSRAAERLSTMPDADRIEAAKTAREAERDRWEREWLARERPGLNGRKGKPLSRMPV